MTRVVVTGMSALTPIGNDWPQAHDSLNRGDSGVVLMDEWRSIDGLGCFLAAPVKTDSLSRLPRKVLRTMSRVSCIAAETAQKAIEESRLALSGVDMENVGIAYGSSFGSAEQLPAFARVASENKVRGISPTAYVQLMSHTASINLSLLLGIKGRLYPTSSACASGGQAIGYAYEAICQGVHPVMIAGSAEELSPMQVAVFDSFYAACRSTESPAQAAKPFAHDRNGLVVGEGGATFVLEELSYAQQRGAPILAEVVGFATNLDGSHVTRQDVTMMKRVMERALDSAGIKPWQVGYINAHAAGTQSDGVEAEAIRQVFGDHVPVSSSKGHIGHALGGCGSLEAWLSINMMNQEWFAPTLNLNHVAEDCSGLAHIEPKGLYKSCDYIMSNNYAFGGVNVSLIFKRWYEGES
ncbi:beta-ketoacyl-ACP synthase [Endozoicomonas atrinae]|uniref:beta-ketoacyl-ACP synthase n=1 Tax=Endozoicomonas atrinae TaxID=1333660 RepID=UPI0008267E97|nr:beta-ketoacyl-ACP synthase [Endozoicomonas atrinae]